MKNLQEIKDEVANESGFNNFNVLLMSYVHENKASLINRAVNEVCERYSKQSYNNALEHASRVIDGWPSKVMTISEEQEEILSLKIL